MQIWWPFMFSKFFFERFRIILDPRVRPQESYKIRETTFDQLDSLCLCNYQPLYIHIYISKYTYSYTIGAWRPNLHIRNVWRPILQVRGVWRPIISVNRRLIWHKVWGSQFNSLVREDNPKYTYYRPIDIYTYIHLYMLWICVFFELPSGSG